MARRSIDQDIDRLYQLPVNDFTRERNALAQEAGGDEGKRIKALPKPSASAWAVNQLYWRDRATYDALLTAAERLRAAHRAVLAGRKADLRAADAAHREAVNAAISSTLRLVKDAGQHVSSAMQMEIARTLESLPADEPPGRLAKPLRPEGFEALQGMPIRPTKSSPPEKPKAESTAREDHRAREQQRKEAQRALQQARQNERRERAAVARLQKQITRSERKTASAKAAWDRARLTESKLRSDLRQAEQSLQSATKTQEEISARD